MPLHSFLFESLHTTHLTYLSSTMTNSVITLTIEKAEALLALNPGGTSNPYITATIGAQSVSTTVQEKTLNPAFNATFTFQDCPLPSIITLRVFNKIQYVDVEDPLGTATLTIFEAQPEETHKTVQLSHGGNAALAQRAPNGCGAVTLRYTVTPMPAAAIATPQPTASAAALSKNASITSASGASTPMPVPAAVNIDGNAPAAMPVAISPKDSNIGTPRAGAQTAGSASGFFASNPSVTNPAATTPKLRPVDGAMSASLGGAAVGPVYASSATYSLTNAHNSQLTPPSLSPARPPAVTTFLVPQVAQPPPSTAGLNMSLKASPENGYVSYVVPGVRVPAAAVVDEAALTQQQQQQQGSGESYYANNVASQPASTPMPAMSVPQPSSASMLPVAPNAPAAVRFASLQESTNAAHSLDAHRTSSASSLYTSAAQAPAHVPQQTLLVVPPHINGTPTPTPTFFHGSATPSREGSRLPSAVQLPTSMAAGAEAFPSVAPAPGTIPVAVAPRTQPLSSSTTNSLRSTPATLSSQGRASAAAAGFPLSAPVTAAAAFPALPHPTRVAATAAAGSTTSPKRRSPKNETTTDAALPSAAELYADAEYLFEAAASGSDEAVFHRLRAVDPSLTNGFVRCLDYSGRSLLHIAAWHGQLRVLQILLAPEPAAPMLDLRAMVAAKSGNTILHAAACGGQAAVAEWLRYAHPSAGPLLLSMRNARNMTAAECAMEAGFPQVARLLIPS